MDKFIIRKRKQSNGAVPKKKRLVESKEGEIIAALQEMAAVEAPRWTEIRRPGLKVDYQSDFLPHNVASLLLRVCEENIEYFTGDLSKVNVFGKWHDIPRKHVAFGDKGLTYTFSRVTVPANVWPPYLDALRNLVSKACGHRFNFVLVNRYAHGNDYMGEHKDNEPTLVKESAIASISLGQSRDFVFRHEDVKLKGRTVNVDCRAPVRMELSHGSLLVIRYPTNEFWYHSLPKRARANGVRLNFTFRVVQN